VSLPSGSPESPSPPRGAALPLTPLGAAARRTITAALLVGTFLASLEVMVVGPAMPSVVADLAGAGLYPWVFTVYILAQTLAIPVYGALADRRGRRLAYLLGVGLFVAGSVVCGLSGSMAVLVAGRTLQGLGAGSLIPLTLTIFGDLYPVAERTRMQGTFSLVWGVSSLGGPAVGGWLTETLGWRAIFWLNVPPGVVAALVVAALLPAVARSTQAGPGLGRPAALTLLREPTHQAVVASGLMLGAALLGIIGYLPVWVQAVHGGSPLDAGLALIPMSISWTLAANVAGRVVSRTGFRLLVRLGTALTAAGAALAALHTASPLGLTLFGLGMGATVSSFTVAAQEAAPLALRGSATSLSLLARSVGGAVAVPVLGTVAGMRPGAADFAQVQGLAAGLERVFAVIAVCALLAAVAAWARFPSGAGHAGASRG
jgi:MFS family permease